MNNYRFYQHGNKKLSSKRKTPLGAGNYINKFIMLTLRFTDFSKIVNMTAIKKSFCEGRWIFLIKDILQSTHNLNPSRVREMGRFSFLSERHKDNNYKGWVLRETCPVWIKGAPVICWVGPRMDVILCRYSSHDSVGQVPAHPWCWLLWQATEGQNNDYSICPIDSASLVKCVK